MLLSLEKVRQEYRISLKQVEDILAQAGNNMDTPEGCAILNLLIVKFYQKLLQEAPNALFFNLAIQKCHNANQMQTRANVAHFKQFVSLYLTYLEIGHDNLQALEESRLVDCTYMFVIKIFSKVITIIEQHKSFEAELKELLRSAALLYVASLEVQRPIPEGRLIEISALADNLVTDFEKYIKMRLSSNADAADVLVYIPEDTLKYKELLRPGQQAA